MSAEPSIDSRVVTACSQALRQVWDDIGSLPAGDEQARHVEAVSRIVESNLSTGRWASPEEPRDTSRPEDSSLSRYALRVARHYWAERAKVAALSRGEAGEWESLRRQLEVRAYYLLCTCARGSTIAPREEARDCAQEACQKILCARYPCDVPFDAWATRILLNCARARLGRSCDLLDRGAFPSTDEDSADRIPERSRSATDPLQHLEDTESRRTLLAAIDQLPSEAQRQVILLDFFYDCRVDEIARALDKTRQAVYNLRNRAMGNLRQLLRRPMQPGE